MSVCFNNENCAGEGVLKRSLAREAKGKPPRTNADLEAAMGLWEHVKSSELRFFLVLNAVSWLYNGRQKSWFILWRPLFELDRKKAWQAGRVLAAMIPFCEIIIIFYRGPGRRDLLSPQWGMEVHTESLWKSGTWPIMPPSFIPCSNKRLPLCCQWFTCLFGPRSKASHWACDGRCDIKSLSRHDLLLNIIIF